MEPNNNKQNDPKKPGGKKPRGNIWITLIITVAVLLLISSVFNMVRRAQFTETSLSEYITAFEENRLSEVEIQYDRIIYMTKEEAEKPAAQQKAFYTGRPGNLDVMAHARELYDMGVTVYQPVVEDNYEGALPPQGGSKACRGA